MSERRILLDAAAFLDSPRAGAAMEGLGLTREQVREVAERFLECAYLAVGKAPRMLEGDDLREILLRYLPPRFRTKDPVVEKVPAVVEAYLAHLEETAVVTQAFELRMALALAGPSFGGAVRELAGSAEGIPAREPARPFVNRAPRVGRNDPCPCGSGRKFKQCCARLGT